MATETNDVNDSHGGPELAAVDQGSEKARGDFDLLSKRRKTTSNKRMYLVIGLVLLLFVCVLGGMWAWVFGQMQKNTTPVDESKVKADAGLQVDQAPDDSMVAAREAAIKKQQENEERERRERAGADQPKPAPTTATSGNASQVDRSPPKTVQNSQKQEPLPITPEQRKMMGGIVMSPALQNAASSGATVAGGHAGGAASGNRSDASAQRQAMLDEQAALLGAGGGGMGDVSSSRSRGSLSNLSGTTFTPSKAVLAPKRKYLLAHGTYARCVLYTEIITDQPGIIDCRLTEPVYSADGSTRLADAGDRLTGEQSVEVKAGQVNVFTSWTEMDTQAGVRARLDSLGAGPMGASGTEAWIDNHYMQRFGGAVMLSFIQDALQAAANTTQKSSGSGGYTVNNSEQNVESMASKVLDNTINIPPTAHISPGTVMTVIVARDIDFSTVFENR